LGKYLDDLDQKIYYASEVCKDDRFFFDLPEHENIVKFLDYFFGQLTDCFGPNRFSALHLVSEFCEVVNLI